MSNSSDQTSYNTINFKDLFMVLINKWYLFTGICIVCILLSFVKTSFFTKSMYDSTAKIYIMNKQATNINSNDISVSTYLAKDYEELIIDRSVLEQVNDELKLNSTYEQLKSCIKITNPENTRIIEITVRTTSSDRSKKIADCICEISQEKIVDLMGVDHVSIISKGNKPSTPSTPVLSVNLFKALLVGIVITIVSSLIMYLANDKISGPSDVEKYLGLNVLGAIPYNKNRASSK